MSGALGELAVVGLVGLSLLWPWALADLLRRTDEEWPSGGPSRMAWGLVVVLVPLGGLAYLVAGPPARIGPRRRRG